MIKFEYRVEYFDDEYERWVTWIITMDENEAKKKYKEGVKKWPEAQWHWGKFTINIYEKNYD